MNSISIDVDIDDILWSMSDRDKQELVNDLYDDGIIASRDKRADYKNPKNEFDEACLKLFGESWRLTREQEDYIIELSKRF